MEKHQEKINEEQIHEAVRQRYGDIVEALTSGKSMTVVEADCCSSSSLYDVDVSRLPDDVTQMSLGCGDPVSLASLSEGQTVLDLGSGGGIDCFLAAQRVGEAGRVIGVDMTQKMVDKANKNLEKLDHKNVEFRFGMIEKLPIDDESIDVVISNCVINLSPDKPTVFKEAYRVLRPGGRLSVTDIVTQGQMNPSLRDDMDSWAACIAGAEDVLDYAGAIREAGFVDISVKDKDGPDLELIESAQYYIGSPRVFSARVVATKPQL